MSELVVAEGRDAPAYLHGQLTQDLEAMPQGDTRATLLLEPKGQLTCCGFVTRENDRVTLEVPDGVGERVAVRLRRFALRVAVTVLDPVGCVHPRAPLASEAARVAATIPGLAELDEALVPHSLPTELLEASVSFTKGCYPGQELVARMQARGASAPYVLRSATLLGPAEAGDPAGDERFAGRCTTVARDGDRLVALLVLHRSDAAAGTVAVHAVGGDLDARLR